MTLQDLVERLAATHVEEVKVIDRTTGMPDLVKVTRRPLLADLEDASGTSTGRSGGAGWKSMVPLDADVVKLKAAIQGDLTRDLLRLGVTKFKYATLAEQLARWEAQIRSIVEPRKVREVTVPCPICGGYETFTNDERKTMLTLAYSEDNPAASITLTCDQCGILATGAAAAAAALRIEKVTSA